MGSVAICPGPGGGGGPPVPGSPSPLTPEQLAAQPDANPDDGLNSARAAAREQVAKAWFDKNGMSGEWPTAKNGIDMKKPVQVVNYPPPDQMNQYVRNPSAKYPTPKIGNWMDPKGGQSGDQLGLNTDPACRTPATLNVPPKADGSQRSALSSTAAPITDDWTDKSNPKPTPGGGTQYTITPSDRNDIAAGNPGYC
jgi:hypothetical protein